MKRFYDGMAKRTLLTIIIVFLNMLSFAATYYVSNAGNDSNSGLSEATPWRTVAKVNSSSFAPGDRILFKSSNVFYERLTLSSSGSKESEIVLSYYGEGKKPEIRGYGEVTGWTVSGNWSEYTTGVYRMTMTTEFNRLWINGAEKKESKTLALDSDHPWRWQSNYLYVKSHINPSGYYNSIVSSKHIYNTSYFANISNVLINGIIFSGGENSLYIVNCKNFRIENCEIGYKTNAYGMWIISNNNDSTSNLLIYNNIFNTGDSLSYDYYREQHTTFEGVYLSSGIVNTKVHNNFFWGWSHAAVGLNALNASYPCHDIEVYNNYITAPLNHYARGLACDYTSIGYNNSFHDNTVVNTSINCQFNGNRLKVYNNIIDTVRGCYSAETPKEGKGISIENYANPTTNMEIYNNTVANCANPGFQFSSYGTNAMANNNIHDNNMFNNDTVSSLGKYAIYIYPNFSNINHNKFTNNHFYNSDATKIVWYKGTSLTVSEFNVTTPAYNDVISGNDAILTYNVPGVGKITTTVADLRIEYNGTPKVKTIAIKQSMIDVKGNRYSGSVTLEPYTSMILLKDNTVAPVLFTEYKSICEGTSYNGWTTSGEYERTLKSASGGDSIVTTNLTVNPKYSVTEDVTIQEGEIYQGWTKSGQYIRKLNSVSSCDSIVTTNLTVENAVVNEEEYTQTIPLVKGDNLFSTYIVPTNPDVSVVMKSIIDDESLIKMQDEAGNSFEYWGSYGGWINNIGSVEQTEGYNIRVKINCTLQVTGKMVVTPLDIPLNTGWNIISFPRTEQVDAMTVIQTLIDQDKLVKVQDEAGNSIENLKQYGGWINNIGNFVPGKAYKIKVNASANLTIEQNYPKSVIIQEKSAKTEYFSTNIEGNGSNHMNINFVGSGESDLSIGDELAAFDGDICVGALQITEDHLISGLASLIASFSTDDSIQNGFTVGNQIQIYKWNQLTGNKSNIQVEIVDGQMTYEKNASVVVQMKSLTTGTATLSDLVKIDVFPNPSQGKITVRFSELPDMGSRIDILDISGRKVASRLISDMSEEFDLDQQPAGLYLVKSFLGSDEIIKKLIINK